MGATAMPPQQAWQQQQQAPNVSCGFSRQKAQKHVPQGSKDNYKTALGCSCVLSMCKQWYCGEKKSSRSKQGMPLQQFLAA
jgi:hypothetical protein